MKRVYGEILSDEEDSEDEYTEKLSKREVKYF